MMEGRWREDKWNSTPNCDAWREREKDGGMEREWWWRSRSWIVNIRWEKGGRGKSASHHWHCEGTEGWMDGWRDGWRTNVILHQSTVYARRMKGWGDERSERCRSKGIKKKTVKETESFKVSKRMRVGGASDHLGEMATPPSLSTPLEHKQTYNRKSKWKRSYQHKVFWKSLIITWWLFIHHIGSDKYSVQSVTCWRPQAQPSESESENTQNHIHTNDTTSKHEWLINVYFGWICNFSALNVLMKLELCCSQLQHSDYIKI